mmetsp:Transcript_29041/g.56799  ORF Transcript_29041/g.56799 Transcript_29041/m.56799 type:complete len:234 (-) Transcript_29041:1267-1968(-)
MSTRCQDCELTGPCHFARSTARPKSTRPNTGLDASPSTSILCEFTSLWYANLAMCSNVGANCNTNSLATEHASTKSKCCCAVMLTFPEFRFRRQASRNLSIGTPGTFVMAKRTRHISVPVLSVSVPTKSGIRSRGSRLPLIARESRPPPGLYDEPQARLWPWIISNSLPSNAALESSAEERHWISLIATSPPGPPSRHSAAQTVPKLPVPNADVTWHLQPPIVKTRPVYNRWS